MLEHHPVQSPLKLEGADGDGLDMYSVFQLMPSQESLFAGLHILAISCEYS